MAAADRGPAGALHQAESPDRFLDRARSICGERLCRCLHLGGSARPGLVRRRHRDLTFCTLALDAAHGLAIRSRSLARDVDDGCSDARRGLLGRPAARAGAVAKHDDRG